jgi:hypothetical protein
VKAGRTQMRREKGNYPPSVNEDGWLTRGKRLVVLVRQKKAVAIAVRNVSGPWRWSKLAEWLSADASKRYESE